MPESDPDACWNALAAEVLTGSGWAVRRGPARHGDRCIAARMLDRRL